MHCLIYRTGTLGDALITIPALSAFRQKHPDVTCYTLLTNTPKGGGSTIGCSEVFSHFGLIDKTVFYRSPIHLFFLVLRNFFRRSYTHLLYLPGERAAFSYHRDVLLFKFGSGIKFKFQYFAPRQGLRNIPHGESSRLLAAVLECQTGQCGLLLKNILPRKGKMNLDGPWPTLGRDVSSVAVFCDAKSQPSQLANTRWLELFDVLEKSNVNRIMIFTRDSYLVERLKISYSSFEVFNNTFSFDHLINRIGGVDCAITLDSGPAHLAAMLGIPTLVVSSSRHHPSKWLPIGDKVSVFRSMIDCEECELLSCPKGNRCVDDAAKMCIQFLKKNNEI